MSGLAALRLLRRNRRSPRTTHTGPRAGRSYTTVTGSDRTDPVDSLEADITRLYGELVRPSLEKIRNLGVKLRYMEQDLLRTDEEKRVTEIENSFLALKKQQEGLDKQVKVNMDQDSRYMDILRRYGVYRTDPRVEQATVRAQESLSTGYLESEWDLPDVASLIDFKKQSHGDVNIEYVAGEVFRLKTSVYDMLKTVADEFVLHLQDMSSQVENDPSHDIRVRMDELHRLREEYKMRSAVLKQRAGDIENRVLDRTRVDRSKYSTHVSRYETQHAKELEYSITQYEQTSKYADEYAMKLEKYISGSTDHGDWLNTLFGTVHYSGRCRRSTSFGKYVLSLS